MTSRHIITGRVTSTRDSMMPFTSRSQQCVFVNSKWRHQYRAQLTASQQGVIKAGGLSNTLRVQKGQRAEKGDTVTHRYKFLLWQHLNFPSKWEGADIELVHAYQHFRYLWLLYLLKFTLYLAHSNLAWEKKVLSPVMCLHKFWKVFACPLLLFGSLAIC